MHIESIIKALLFCPGNNGHWCPPALFQSAPGMAKSTIILGVAARCGLPTEHLKPSERGEGFFGVVPVPKDGRLTYPAPDWVRAFDETGRGLVFVDEINKADPTILQPPLFGLVNDRVIGSTQLPGGVRVLAAGNPVTTRTFGHDMDSALANRMAHLAWPDLTADDWVGWVLRGCNGVDMPQLDPAAEEKRVLAQWDAVFSTTSSLVASFIKARPGLLHKQPDDSNPQASGAWPSPRTWEMAMRALAAVKIHGLDAESEDYLLGGYVGSAAAVDFAAWRRQVDLPDIEALLDGKVSFKPNPARLDRTWAVLNGAVSWVLADKTKAKKDRAAALWKLLGVIADEGADLVAEPSRILMGAGLLAPETVKTLAKMKPVFQAAGKLAEKAA